MNWKKLFWILAIFDIAIVVLICAWLFQPSKPVSMPSPKKIDGASFTVYSNKEHLNMVINDYIRKKTDGHPAQYRVWLDDRVYVASELPVFGRNVALTVSFVPKVVKGGDIELQHPEILLDDWKLPVTYVLKYLSKHAPLPDEVIIDPSVNRVYVALTDIRFGKGYQIAAKNIDLKRDKIVFTLTIPAQHS
ncbi:YpmS family protein [Parageobacillus thermoglucosidasius]|uniref:YpmS family protein n=1 Tax=Parageobacillus thermoglucosidasius TaxID=1426 RepID=UPI000B564736|nr:YpmS family protein [Parageobacillus thermoglucosidasius]MBY6266919.1 DUF2140 domain-containing protein [Parageobacillus thermoglucosidasius]OUM88879.1 MAG: hypothetical protein BAA00_07850 [Parageobacillus thermoglucosidasius]